MEKSDNDTPISKKITLRRTKRKATRRDFAKEPQESQNGSSSIVTEDISLRNISQKLSGLVLPQQEPKIQR